MENLNRRDLCLAFAALAATQANAQTTAPVLATSQSFPYDQLTVKKSPNGGESRAVTKGVLVTGETVEVHETTLPPGQMPHPPHKHRDSEFIMIRQGTVEFYHDGKTEQIGPGGVMFNASNQMHAMKNIGTTDALYFVVEISAP
jgi:quercetin dioxygenase-like cupin family protein